MPLNIPFANKALALAKYKHMQDDMFRQPQLHICMRRGLTNVQGIDMCNDKSDIFYIHTFYVLNENSLFPF